MEKYSNIIPKGADRIMKMAESEQSHRHELDKENIKIFKDNRKQEIKHINLGQMMGFVLALIFVLGGLFLSYKGKVFGNWIAGGTLVALVSLFIKTLRQTPPRKSTI